MHTDPNYPIRVRKLDATVAVCRLDPDHGLEPWMQQGAIWSVARTPDELSVVSDATAVPDGVRHEGPFVVFMVEGPLDFALTGIVARLSVPLASAGIPLFVLSTFDTDYVLVPAARADAAQHSWRGAGIAGVGK